VKTKARKPTKRRGTNPPAVGNSAKRSSYVRSQRKKKGGLEAVWEDQGTFFRRRSAELKSNHLDEKSGWKKTRRGGIFLLPARYSKAKREKKGDRIVSGFCGRRGKKQRGKEKLFTRASCRNEQDWEGLGSTLGFQRRK